MFFGATTILKIFCLPHYFVQRHYVSWADATAHIGLEPPLWAPAAVRILKVDKKKTHEIVVSKRICSTISGFN